MSIEKINIKIKKSSTPGIFHDSRSDVIALGEALNKSIKKINELVDEVNRLKGMIDKKEE